MKIATFNVNSVRARAENLSRWLERVELDVLCLQETKVTDDLFPHELFQPFGYRCLVHGQKGYNGVATCLRSGADEVAKGFGDGDDEERRVLSVRLGELWIVNVYAPHGELPGNPKHDEKLAFFRRFREFLQRTFDPQQPLVVVGDMNVARTDQDVWDPAALEGTIGVLPDEREAFEHVLAWGLEDCYRKLHPKERAFTWWDYRTAGIWRDEGMRIDYVLGTEPVAKRCRSVEVDLWPRRRRTPKPSDHAPVIAEFDWP